MESTRLFSVAIYAAKWIMSKDKGMFTMEQALFLNLSDPEKNSKKVVRRNTHSGSSGDYNVVC